MLIILCIYIYAYHILFTLRLNLKKGTLKTDFEQGLLLSAFITLYPLYHP
jgi:hypothetical protein